MQRDNSDLNLVISWSIIGLLAEIPYTIFLYIHVRKEFSPKIDVKSLLKYFISSVIIFGLVFILMENYLVYKESIFEFLPELMVFLIISMAGYLGLTYLIDERTRMLSKAVINEIRGKKQ